MAFLLKSQAQGVSDKNE